MWRQASLEDETITENSGGTPSVRAQGGSVTRLEGVGHVLFLKLGGVNIHCLSWFQRVPFHNLKDFKKGKRKALLCGCATLPSICLLIMIYLSGQVSVDHFLPFGSSLSSPFLCHLQIARDINYIPGKTIK